jgi:hypothetical protein
MWSDAATVSSSFWRHYDMGDRLDATDTRRWRISDPVTDVLCKPSFADFLEKSRDRWKRPLPDNLS